jgi:hypothetical protein
MDEDDDPSMRWFDRVITVGTIVLAIGFIVSLITSLFME